MNTPINNYTENHMRSLPLLILTLPLVLFSCKGKIFYSAGSSDLERQVVSSNPISNESTFNILVSHYDPALFNNDGGLKLINDVYGTNSSLSLSIIIQNGFLIISNFDLRFYSDSNERLFTSVRLVCESNGNSKYFSTTNHFSTTSEFIAHINSSTFVSVSNYRSLGVVYNYSYFHSGNENVEFLLNAIIIDRVSNVIKTNTYSRREALMRYDSILGYF